MKDPGHHMTDDGVHIQWPDGSPELRLPPASPLHGNLAERIARAGRPLNTRCGQRGLCAGCTVELVTGSFHEKNGAVIPAPAAVKACQGDVSAGEGATMVVPIRSLAVHSPQVVSSFKVNIPAAQDPSVPVVAGSRDHGLAIDVGTTTVVVALVDLATGAIVGDASALNRQVEMGDNVLTRIQLAGEQKARIALQDAIVKRTIEPLVREVCSAAGVGPERLAGAVVAGNTTMLHLLTGTDPTPMGVAPFRAPFTDHRILAAGELGMREIPAGAPVHLLPGFSAYVGADLVAGAMCTGLFTEPGPSLLVDIGTNGEIVLCHDGRLLATATAAGPAFEGGRLSNGTRAVAGAVERIAFPDGRFPPAIEVIGGARRAIGICGSGYVDFLGLGRRIGLLTPNGRLNGDAWEALPPEHRHAEGGSRGVVLNPREPATTITEADIAHLLQAKAAIAAGILALLRRAGLAPGDIRRVHLAGGFGLHIDVAHAIGCGLLPGFVPSQVEAVGNTSLGGAWLALVDRGILTEMTAHATAAEIVELNLEPGFEDSFIDQLALP